MENYIKLASMTEAMRAKNILQKYGIFSKVQRIPGKNSRVGCSFGIIVPRHTPRAIEILGGYNIYPVGRAYGDEE